MKRYDKNDRIKKKSSTSRIVETNGSKETGIKEYDLVTKINIDSRHRSIESKNILNATINYLYPNSLHILPGIMNSEVTVHHPDHTFEVNDSIVLQGAQSITVALNDGITFIGNSSYVKINHKNHGINFASENDSYITISGFHGNNSGNTSYNNIPINVINSLHKIYSTKDLNETNNGDYYYIVMDGIISNFSSTYNDTSIKISFNDINGIDLGLINANYPIDITQKQGYHTITETTIHTYTFTIPISNNILIESVGGNNIWTAKVDEFVQGFPMNNHYKIPLRRTFQNITQISLISTEIPNTEKVIKSSGDKKNNAFYWKLEDDGNTEYSVNLDEGNYSINSLISELESKINSQMRDAIRIINLNISTYEYYTYNQCNISIEPGTDSFSASFFSTIFYPKAISYRVGSNFDDGDARLVITHPDHRLTVGNTIQIVNAISTNGVPQNVINNAFFVEKVISDSSYQVKLPKHNISAVDKEVTNGGDAMGIKFPIKSQLLMSKTDSVCSLLGFRNIGKTSSITPYDYSNSNKVSYIEDYIEENQSINTSINLSGGNYILMCNPIFNSSLNTGTLDHVFAKLLLVDEPGTVIYDRYVQMDQSFNPPLQELSEWEVSFYDVNEKLFNFGNIEHSYTLEIHEKIIKSV